MAPRLFLPFCLVLVATVPVAAGKDLSSMYSPETLAYWKQQFTPLVQQIMTDVIAPAMTRSGRAESKEIRIELPISTAANDPFMDVVSGAHKITIPVLTLKFLYDLIAAREWLTAHGFEEHTAEYVGALKYQGASGFPGGRYLSPLEAFDIPRSARLEPADDSAVARVQLRRTFVGAVAFLLGHEVQHVLEPGKEMSLWARESLADEFAVRVVSRANITPAGVLWYFIYAAEWVKNAGDFESGAAYERWVLTSGSSHPLSGFRLQAIGKRIESNPREFFPDADDGDPRLALLRLIGSKLVSIGEPLGKLETSRLLRDVAIDVDVASLKVHRRARAATSNRRR